MLATSLGLANKSKVIRPLHESLLKGFLGFEKAALAMRGRVNEIEGAKDFLEKTTTELMELLDVHLSPLGKLAKVMTAEERRAHQIHLTNSEIHKAFLGAPCVWRAFTKPQGYAGDAALMDLIYRNKFEGAEPFDKVVHKVIVGKLKCSEALRNRKAYIKKHITALTGSDKVLSMAAGPAREIEEFLQENPNAETQFLALDHDVNTLRDCQIEDPRFEYAIANAFHFIRGESTIAFPRKIPYINHHHDPCKDFKGLRALLAPVHYRMVSLPENNYNLVYTAGLYDYIINFETSAKGCKALTKFLFEKVAPGGKLVIGNYNWSMPDVDYFLMEFVADWKLFYRNDTEIYSFLDGIDRRLIANAQIECEPSGINSFLVVTKSL